MKLNQIITLASTGLVGALAGFLMTSGQHKNIAQTLSAAGATGLGVGIISQVIASNQLAKKDKEVTQKEREIEDKFKTAQSELEIKFSTANQRIEKDSKKAIAQSKHFERLAEYYSELLAAKLAVITENKRMIGELEKVQQQLIDTQDNLTNKDAELLAVSGELETVKKRVVQLELEAKQADDAFDESLEIQTQARFKELKSRWIDEWTTPYDEIIHDTFQLKNRLLDCAEKLKTRCKDRREFVNGYTDKLNDIAGRAEENFNKEKLAYLEQIELLNEKVARFQQLANGDLVEPVYKNVGYALHGKIANDIAKEIFRVTSIPLQVFGYQQGEELTRVGYGFSKSGDAIGIVQTIQSISKDIAQELRIHAITSVELSDISPVIHLNFRKEPPKPETHEAIYKAGLIPARDFCATVDKAMEHTTKGKHTLRVMAATGEGKGIAIKNLLDYFTDKDNHEIWLSDPMHGLDEDYWDTPKIATSSKEAKKAYELFHRLYIERKEKKQPGFTTRDVIAVFDEFDKEHDKDDKITALDIATAIRHAHLKQILVGQSAEVGSNGWTWGDMTNCSLLVLGGSIDILIKHLKPDMGWSAKEVKAVRDANIRFTSWVKTQNESNPDVPNENQTRIGLLLVGKKWQFLELPIAHKGIIKSNNAVFRTSLNVQSNATREAITYEDNNIITNVITDHESEITCPHCKSTNVRKAKKHHKTKEQMYVCKDCTDRPRNWIFTNSK